LIKNTRELASNQRTNPDRGTTHPTTTILHRGVTQNFSDDTGSEQHRTDMGRREGYCKAN
jgi:hypothetical protein